MSCLKRKSIKGDAHFLISVFLCLALVACGGGSGNGDGTPGWFEIVSPVSGSTVNQFPVTFEIAYGGSIRADSWNARLTTPGASDQPITAAFVAQSGTATAILTQLAPNNYDFTVSVSDTGGNVLTSTVPFTVPAFVDLVLPPKSIGVIPGQPLKVGAVVVNQGNLPAPPTTVDVVVIPDDPGEPPPDLPPVDIPPLGPGESFPLAGMSLELIGPGSLTMTVDPGNGIIESDETNNVGTRPVFPGSRSTWTDLALDVRDFTINALDEISLRIDVRNIGTTQVTQPRLRYFVWDDASGTALAVMGGGAGQCIDPNPDAAFGVISLNPMQPEETVTQEYTLNFSGLPTTPSGSYRMCVEVVASASSDPDPHMQWEPFVLETDEYNTPMVVNNHKTLNWDVRNLGNFPAGGDVTVFKSELTDPRAGYQTWIYTTLSNHAFPDIGYAAAKLVVEAVGGVDDGVTEESTSFTPFIIGGERQLLKLPLPGLILAGSSAQLPRTPELKATLIIHAGQDGSGAELLVDTRRFTIEYHDVYITDMSATPPAPMGHPPTLTGEPPLNVTVHVKNDSSAPVAFDLELADLISGADNGPIGSPVALSLGVGETAQTDFSWTPTQLGSHELEANLTGLNPLNSPNTHGEARSLFYRVTLPPEIHGLDVTPEAVLMNPGQPVPLSIQMVDRASSGESFTLEVHDPLASSNPVFSETVGPIYGITWVDFPTQWVPQRAGYHELSFRVVNTGGTAEERFRHRVDITPELKSVNTFAAIPASEHEYNNSGGLFGPLKLFARAEGIIVGGDGSGVTGAKLVSFTVDDGTTNPDNAYLMRINAHSSYAGVTQAVSIFWADTLWRAGVGMGVRKVGNTSFCWDREACPDDFLVHRTLWYDETGGLGIGKLVAAAGETIVSEAVSHLVDVKWGAAGSTALSAVGVALELGFAYYDAAVCDGGGDGGGDAWFTVPVYNTQEYALYIIMESRVASAAIFGDAYSYVDFYDYMSPNCGGKREGIDIELLDYELYPLPR